MFRNYEPFGTPLLTDPSVPGSARFVLENANSTIANTLRRCILMDTRSASFRADLTKADDPGVVIRKNTSLIFNEMLAHRLTLLPLAVTRLDEFEPSNYECVLRVRNDSGDYRHVTASDFILREKQPDGSFEDVEPRATAAMFPKDPITRDSSLLVTLRPQWNREQPVEEVDLTAYPIIGTGREFMGFSPVSQCSFENTRDEDPLRQEQFLNEWIIAYKKVADPAALTPADRDTYRAEWETMAVQRCFKVGADGQPNSFTFTVESVGVRPVADIVAEGIQAVVELVSPYMDAGRPMAELGMSTQPVDSRMNGINVLFEGHDHTLGNLLQTTISDIFLDAGAADSPITFAGYKVRHPLQRTVTLTLGFRDGVAGDPVTIARQVIAEAATRARSIYEELGRSWAAQVGGLAGAGGEAELLAEG